ncbi:MAG: SpoIID/LytB domain-containing protein, partial [Fimbriimonadales bacterium]
MRYGKGIACLLGAVWMSALALAQSIPFNLRFHDSATGRALIADVQLTHLPTQTVYQLRSNSDGRAAITLPEGEYLLYANSAGYQAVGLTVRLEEPMPPYRFFLDPVEPPLETRTQFLWSLRKPGQMLVVGWLMDDLSGQPIANARIQVLETGTQSLTDSRGFFLVQFPVEPCKTGYATLQIAHEGYRTRQLEKVQVWSEGDWIYRLTLEPGSGLDTTDMRSPRHRQEEPKAPCTDCKPEPSPTEPEPEPPSDFVPLAPAPIVLPKYIRVGRNCTSRTNCPGGVEVYTIDTYCKGVITSEWYACWGNVPGGMDSLRAGAVAVRSYGVSFVYSPATSTYDICDSTSCQVFTGNQTSNGNAAVDATTRYVLLTSAGNIARSEYSAENNNAGCGNGYSGTGSSWPCIYDPVCSGFSTNGHGRGMCQWGSARWATGRRLSSSQACTTAAPQHGFGTKNWQEILNHYYAPGGYQLVQGAVASITNLTASPNPTTAGSTGTLARQ